MQGPLSFQPSRHDVEDIPIDVHNKIVEELELTKQELKRAQQKIAYLLKELKDK